MEPKAIVSSVVTAAVTAGVLGVFAWGAGVFNAGSDAIDKEQIREVLQEEMQTDSGITYGAALNQIGLDINTVSTQVKELKDDVNDLEDTVLDLAGGG